MLDIERVETEIAACVHEIAECEEEQKKNVAAQHALTTRTDTRGVSTPRRRLGATAQAQLAHLRSKDLQLGEILVQLLKHMTSLREKEAQLLAEKARLEGTRWPALHHLPAWLCVAARLRCVRGATSQAKRPR